MELHEYKIAEKLRKARALATELRSILEDVQGELRSDFDESYLDNLTELQDAIDENVMDAGTVEEWLDSLPINEDGSTAESQQ
jgi:hypothetical protein